MTAVTPGQALCGHEHECGGVAYRCERKPHPVDGHEERHRHAARIDAEYAREIGDVDGDGTPDLLTWEGDEPGDGENTEVAWGTVAALDAAAAPAPAAEGVLLSDYLRERGRPDVAGMIERAERAAQQPQAAPCPVAFIPDDPDACSCTCKRAEGHPGFHHCPECEASWYLASGHPMPAGRTIRQGYRADQCPAAPAPQPAPSPLEVAYLYHWRFDRGEEFGLYWNGADADAKAAEHAGEGLSEVLSLAILGDRPEPQAAPVADAGELVRRVRQAWDAAFTGSAETAVDVQQAWIAVETVLAAQQPQAAHVYRLACGCPIAAGKNPLGNWTCIMHGPTTMIGEAAQ